MRGKLNVLKDVAVLLVWVALSSCTDVPPRQLRGGRAVATADPRVRHAFGAVLLQNPRLALRALRGGGSESSDARRMRTEGEDERQAGGEDSVGQAVDDDDDFSLGAVSDAPAAHESGGAGQSNVQSEAKGADEGAADRATEVGEPREGASGEISEGGDDDADVVECKFERVGDTNGVFYYLGMQRCAESTGDVIAQALISLPSNPAQGAGEHDGRRRFQNPALTGRVQIKTGPQKVMCGSKFKGRMACPEEVLERNVVGDQFWFPDGWFVIDLGLHTTLQVTPACAPHACSLCMFACMSACIANAFSCFSCFHLCHPPRQTRIHSSQTT